MANAGKFLLHYYLQNYLDTIERRVLPDEYWFRYTVARNQVTEMNLGITSEPPDYLGKQTDTDHDQFL